VARPSTVTVVAADFPSVDTVIVVLATATAEILPVASTVAFDGSELVHVNGLTFDFLYAMAKELDKRQAFMLIRGGEKGDKPIVMNRGGKAYNAFLEGRVKGDAYCLILHLSNLELKRPMEAGDNGAEH